MIVIESDHSWANKGRFEMRARYARLGYHVFIVTNTQLCRPGKTQREFEAFMATVEEVEEVSV